MRISVIIPVHDLGYKIETCLDSIYAQNFDKTEYEILVILDSCTDNSQAIVSEWHKGHGLVDLRMFVTQCHCPGGARNVGLDNARGEYIIFVDGDDYLMNNSAMTILYNAAQGYNAVRVMDHGISGRQLKFNNRLTMWLHFFSRKLIGTERFTDMLLNEDFEFVKRVRSKPGYNEAIVTTPLYFYNYDKDRMLARIRNVLALSRERKEQGLPPLYVSDEFVVNSVHGTQTNETDMPSGGLSGSGV